MRELGYQLAAWTPPTGTTIDEFHCVICELSVNVTVVDARNVGMIHLLPSTGSWLFPLMGQLFSMGSK